MKVLQLGKFYPIRGGVEKVMWDLTKGLRDKGIDTKMLCAVGEKDFWDEAKADPCLIPVRSWAKVAATMIAPGMIFKLHRIAREYDIIHVHHPDPMAALSLFLSGYKGTVILHWHSDILKQKGLLKLYLPLQNWLVQRADRIVGTTPVYVRESPFLKDVQDKVTYMPIGVEKLDGIEVPESGLNIVYSLGRLVGYKGYAHLVEAGRYLPDNYRIVIGGDGPLKKELEARIESLGLSGKVELIGRVPDESIVRRYCEAKVFVLPSIWKTEAFGIVQIEAMSLGKPVVATEIPGSGTSWVNEDGVSGLNVEPEDAEAIAEAIVRICEDRERYLKFSESAKERYESMFTLEKMIDNCIRIYNETKQGIQA